MASERDLSPLLIEQLLDNIGFDETVTFYKHEKGLRIKRTGKCGETRLDQVVTALEIRCCRFDLLGEVLYRMALELRSIPPDR